MGKTNTLTVNTYHSVSVKYTVKLKVQTKYKHYFCGNKDIHVTDKI